MMAQRDRTGRAALFTGFVLWAVFAMLPVAHAQLLDEIQVAEENGFARVSLSFSVPVRYVRHFPPEHGEIIRVFLGNLALDAPDEADRIERRLGFTSKLVPPFTVTYTARANCDRTPKPICVVIQFEKPVSYTIRVGDDGRRLLLFIPLAPPDVPAGTSPVTPGD
jgi:hypothetical protein